MTARISVLRPVGAPSWWDGAAKSIEFWLRRVGGVEGASEAVSSDTTLGLTGGAYFVDASSGPVVVSLPPSGTATGRYDVKKTDATANTVTIEPDGSETIDGAANVVISTQYDRYSIRPNGSQWWIL